MFIKKKLGKAIPGTGHEGHGVVRGQGSHVSRQVGLQMAVRLSGLHTSRCLPTRKVPGSHFC
jgi:D-arabinose 1-dehydrogenase-like Zn-dependent alcohol dehydrogenase